MPRNFGKGGKAFRKGKKQDYEHREIALATEGTQYASVKAVLGNSRVEVVSFTDGLKRIGHIRGSMYKRQWVCKDDIVLISVREFQPDRCDIVCKYNKDEVLKLQRLGHLPETLAADASCVEHGEVLFADSVDEPDVFDIDDI